MLANSTVYPTIPAHDLHRARQFYAEKLGLHPAQEIADGLIYECGGSGFLLYASSNAGTAKNTAMSWYTDEIESEVAALQANGVVFEDYDFPGLKTVNGIADIGSGRSAWFIDSEGNTLAISQMG